MSRLPILLRAAALSLLLLLSVLTATGCDAITHKKQKNEDACVRDVGIVLTLVYQDCQAHPGQCPPFLGTPILFCGGEL